MPKLIITCHQKGGVGKSTITSNLAKNINQHAKVVIVDMDLQGSLHKTKDYSEVDVYSASDLEMLKNSDVDFIFVDTPPYLNNELPRLISDADLIIVPTKVGVYDFLAIEDTISMIEAEGKAKKALIVLNMVKPNTSLTSEMNKALTKYNVSISNNYLSNLVAYTRSSMTNELTHTKAKRQIDALTKEVLKYLSK